MTEKQGETEDQRITALEDQMGRVTTQLSSLSVSIDDIRQSLKLGGGPEIPTVTIDGNRVQLEGRCDGKFFKINRTNGAEVTIKLIKRLGDCRTTLWTLDDKGKPIDGTDEGLSSGETLGSYTSKAEGRWTAFSCFGQGHCKIEIDR